MRGTPPAGPPTWPFRTTTGGSGWPGHARTPTASAGEPSTSVVAVVAVAVALMPLVSPKLPGNAAPVDVLIGLGVFVVVLWALRTRATVRFPYIIPMTALVAVGLLSALVNVSTLGGITTGIQEIFLFLWCAALATVCRTPRALSVVLRTWALSATAWAAVLVAAVITGASAISGNTGKAGTRASLFFDHPNMAGNYFMIAVFIVVASGCPQRVWLRVGASLLLIAAMFSTGSNAALLSLIGGGLVALFLYLKIHRGIVRAIAATAMLVAVLGIGLVEFGRPLLAAAQQSDNVFLRYSVGRGARSAENRASLFLEQFKLYQEDHLLGIGPANTRNVLGTSSGALVKEAHNDYLGTLVERGPIGALALAGLIGAVGVRAIGVTSRPLPPRVAAAVPVPAALVGACAAFALTAVTHEVLHYRWLWTLLALLAAVHLLARAAQEPPAKASPGAGLVQVGPRARRPDG